MTDTRNLEYAQAAGFTFISAGAAYNLTLEFYPDFVEVYNYTESGTVAKIVKSTWFRGFPAGDCISIQSIADNGSTAGLNSVLETTNGFTWAGAATAFTASNQAMSGASAASPCVITSNGHGLSNGDRVFITDNAVGGMVQLNNREFVVALSATNTFALNDVYGNNIDSSGYDAWTSGGTINRSYADTATENIAETYILTIGTGAVGANSDVMYVNAVKYPGGITDLGDIA